MAIKPIPEEYRATPYLICRNAAAALEWYKQAFGASEVVRLADSSGKLMHAEVRIGTAPVMLADEFPEMGYKSPASIGGSPVSVHIYVENVDQVFTNALTLGASEIMAVSDQFDGDRRGTLIDPYGHTWLIATKIENVSFPEMLKRFEHMVKGD